MRGRGNGKGGPWRGRVVAKRPGGGGSGGGLRRRRRRREDCAKINVVKARGGGGLGGGTLWCGGGGGGGCRSPSLIFLEQPLEREFTPFFLQMTARVCGRVPSPLIEPIVGRERKGPT